MVSLAELSVDSVSKSRKAPDELGNSVSVVSSVVTEESACAADEAAVSIGVAPLAVLLSVISAKSAVGEALLSASNSALSTSGKLLVAEALATEEPFCVKIKLAVG